MIIIKNIELCYFEVINGVGGNLVSIYSARLSTEISRDPDSFGNWSYWAPSRFYLFPRDTFCRNKSN
jgi:hypothetical protein